MRVMKASTVASRLHRSSSVPGSVQIAAARAAVYSVTSTVLAVAGHYVVFDVSPSWAARGFVAGLLFGAAHGTGLRAAFRGWPMVGVFGSPMPSWAESMPAGMLLKSPPSASVLSAPKAGFRLDDRCGRCSL
ncbi:hypothetical protein [Streptomyces sp. SID2888]|uniref:hypothetical protein n=1 Tax=Streptomyces sp. SID2888 TaxID=2690256 RepID=UPI0019294CD9